MMTFDTAAAIQTLIDRGIQAGEASAIVRVMVDSQRDLVTKPDLELALAPIKTELAVLKWMMGATITLSAAILVKLFLPGGIS